MSRLRVGIVGLLHESNTFVEEMTSLDKFREDLLIRGSEIFSHMESAEHEVGGFLEGLQGQDIEAVPIFFARAVPYGVIEAAAFQSLVEMMVEGLSRAKGLDGVLAAAHGATVSEDHSDADGYWLEKVRAVMGGSMPIVATVDPHANMSPNMVAATDAIIAYSTNPHLDQRQTGIKAAHLIAQTLRNEVRPTQCLSITGLVINIQSQHTGKQPLRDLYAEARSIASGSLSHSIVLGFPYADVAEMGTSVVVVTDDDADDAEDKAKRISQLIWDQRGGFEPRFVNASDAVGMLTGRELGPTVLLDMGDNVGGGAPANKTELLRELKRAGVRPTFGSLCDPAIVARAYSAGKGGVISDAAVGDPSSPFIGDFRVQTLHDGKFAETRARHGGFSVFDQGPTAVLETLDGGVTILVSTRRMPPFSLQQLVSCGVDPEVYRAIVAKGVIAPMAAYRPIAHGGFIHVDTYGPTRADMTKLKYLHRPSPMFPFEAHE